MQGVLGCKLAGTVSSTHPFTHPPIHRAELAGGEAADAHAHGLGRQRDELGEAAVHAGGAAEVWGKTRGGSRGPAGGDGRWEAGRAGRGGRRAPPCFRPLPKLLADPQAKVRARTVIS